jgi:tight adherence protein C
MLEWTPQLIALIAFASVVGVVYVVGRYLVSQASINRRLPIPASAARAEAPHFFASLAGKIDESKFGISGVLRTKLRRDLIRAGYFSEDAIRIYLVARIGLVLILPALVFIYAQIFFESAGLIFGLGLVAVTALIAFFGPDAYLSRRQKAMQHEYRLSFPDMIDMLVVCTDAGLALDAALNRVRTEVSKQSNALGMNLTILGGETRAGRSLTEALGTFADRLNLDEARALVMMLRQSLELGTDVGDALRIFSDEMRAKRILRAEETANKLPVKMVLPLGLFIFPVVLMVIMIPVIIRLLYIFQHV